MNYTTDNPHDCAWGGTLSPEQNLANAIVYRAAVDYRNRLRQRKREAAVSRHNEAEIKMLEEFFRSTLFTILTKVDPEKLMADIQQEVREEK